MAINSLESMVRQLGNSNYNKNKSSIPDGINNAIMADKSFARELLEIANDTSESPSHYTQVYAHHMNQAILMSRIASQEIARREQNISLAKQLMNGKDKTASTEAASKLINILSIESFGSFMKATWENIKAIIKKIINAITSFIKMIATSIRAKFATLQNKYYTDNKGKIAEAVKNNGDAKVTGKMFSNSAPTTKSKLNTQMSDWEKEAKELKEFKLEGSQSDKISQIVGIGQKASQVGGERKKDYKSIINDKIYGSATQPKAAEHKVKDVLGANGQNFEICSKEWLDELGKLVKCAKDLNAACSKALKTIDSVSKVSGDSKDLTAEQKAEAKKLVSYVSAYKTALSYSSNFIYDYFWSLLSVRSFVYRAAKIALKDSDKNDKK